MAKPKQASPPAPATVVAGPFVPQELLLDHMSGLLPEHHQLLLSLQPFSQGLQLFPAFAMPNLLPSTAVAAAAAANAAAASSSCTTLFVSACVCR